MSSTNRAVLIIGGSGGVGRAVAKRLAAAGIVPLVGWANNRESALQVAKQTGGRAIKADLNAIEALMVELPLVLENLTLDGLVLAGAAPPLVETFGRLDETALRDRLEAELFGTRRLLAQITRQYLKPQRTGTIVAVLSEAMGQQNCAGSSGMAGYIIAKYALAGVCAALGVENRWLRLHTLSPGYIDTPMLEAFDPRFVKGLSEAGKVASADDVACEIVSFFEG